MFGNDNEINYVPMAVQNPLKTHHGNNVLFYRNTAKIRDSSPLSSPELKHFNFSTLFLVN